MGDEAAVDAAQIKRKAQLDAAKSASAIRAQMMASSIGALSVALFTTPFDVLKVRMQTATSAAQRTTLGAARALVATHGARGLWLGLGPTVSMSVPSATLYLPAYTQLRVRLEERGVRQPAAVAGGLARGIAVGA